MPSLDVRKEIIRLIRDWKADIVLAPRPYDYHPDLGTRACWCWMRRLWC